MTDILITTTPLLGNIEIQRYLGPLTSNVVLGVNIFSDFAASFTDVLGGKSETYQSKLDSLTYDVDKLMKAKATRMGANAIIDYKLQFNEISGKGKQMFMVTATGTACVITMPKKEYIEEVGQVSYSQIRRQYLISLYRQRLNAKKILTEKDWENIFTLNIFELSKELTDEYFRLKTTKNGEYDFVQYRDQYSVKFEDYLGRLDKSDASTNVYSHLGYNPTLVVDMVIKYNLFDPKVVLNLISSENIGTAIDLIRSHKDYYTKDDLMGMKQIIHLLDNLPHKGTFEISKSGIFSKKEEEMYICPNGHKNPKDTIYCSNCGQNIKGLNIDQDKIINQFKNITAALESIIK